MAKKKNENAIDLHVTNVFDRNLEAYIIGIKHIVNQGGSRSSKTYSVCQLLMYLALQKKLTISIVRKSLPALKQSVMKDMFEILKDHNCYNELNHNKTENTYSFPNGSVIEFFSVDDEQKIRGRKRDICYMNEANELSKEEWLQIALRTNFGAIFYDFNPSDAEHWIYNLLDEEESSLLIKSTYKDNTYLSQAQVEFIENLINTDINYYKIYALGERPTNQTTIYSHFKKYVDATATGKITYGLDFGFNHPTCLVKTITTGNKIYCEELLYENKLTTSDLILKLNNIIPDQDRDKPIYCDYSRPESIEELKRAGFKAKPADKAVKAGIDYLKGKEVYVHVDSVNIWNEVKLYSWKTVNDIITDEPIKLFDDGLDAVRYAAYTGKKSSGTFSYDFVFI